MRWLMLMGLAFALLTVVGWGIYSGPSYYSDVRYLVDPDASLDIKQIKSTDWQNQAQSPINFGFNHSPHWFYFQVPDSLLARAKTVVVEVDFPTINQLSFFVVDDTQDLTMEVETGASKVFRSRQILSENFVFAFDPAVSGRTVYIRAQTSKALQMPIRLYSRSEYLNKEEWALLLWGGYYGVMFIMAVYSLLNGIIMKQSLFYYYSAFIVSTALIISVLNGHGFAYLWPSRPGMNDIAIALFTCLATGFGTAFAMYFLQVRRYHRIYFILGASTMALSFSVALLSVITLRDYSDLATGVAMVFALVILVFAVKALLSRHYLSAYFCSGWLAFLVSISVFSLNIFGVLPSNVVTQHSKEFGNVLEILLFSLGLSAIYSREKQERDRIQQALQLMRERLKNRVNIVNDKSGYLEIPDLQKHLHDIRGMDRRIHKQMGRILVISVMVIDKVTKRPDYIALGDCLRALFNSRITVFPFKTETEGLTGEITVLLFPLHNKFEAEGVIEKVANWKYSLGDQYDLHFGYAISHITEKYDIDYLEESFHYLEEAVSKKSMAHSIDDTLAFVNRVS